MTTETLENNKLIAEFMGGIFNKNLKNVVVLNGEKNFIDRLSFHSSWEWLMPVIEKIEKEIKKVRDDFSVTITGNSCIIPIPYSSSIITHGQTKIEAVWLAVIQYIARCNIIYQTT